MIIGLAGIVFLFVLVVVASVVGLEVAGELLLQGRR